MALNQASRRVLAALEDGLPLDPRPYAVLADRVGLTEQEFTERLATLIDEGVVTRFGLVVRHHELGYRANAMVVWDVPDHRVDEVGCQMGAVPYITLAYRRPRRLPDWPYNLFCMIHGRDRAEVEAQVEKLIEAEDLQGIAHEILFSTRRFKQRGARYCAPEFDLRPTG